MKHFVGMKKEQGLVATVSNFNRWFGDAESEDLRKVWLHVVCCMAQHRFLMNLRRISKLQKRQISQRYDMHLDKILSKLIMSVSEAENATRGCQEDASARHCATVTDSTCRCADKIASGVSGG
jgi:hypothetical protein